jgi:Zn2+/Cd2+-exporting ATPase
MRTPYVFDEFFASGKEESISPFLTKKSRAFGKNLSIRSASGASLLLALAFAVSFHSPPLSHLFLSFVYFLVGVPALIAAISDLKNLEINIDLLMTLAAFVAVFIGSGLEGGLLLVLFELSHGMEEAVSKKARSALHNLNNLAPKFAFLIDPSGNLYEKAVRDIGIGDKVLVKNGEVVPLDGVVVTGESSVNLVHLTGESLPVPKAPGDPIPAGARNLEAALTVEVNRTSSDSTLARIIHLITQAHDAKPRLQRWLDQFGKRYATAVIGLTFLFALALPFILATSFFGHEGSVYRALAFLIAASPCALIIATPTAYLSAISACAKRGILLKGGVTLDALASCSSVAFDKTGTLTTGQLL